MDLTTIGAFINDNGLAVFLLLCMGWAFYKIYVDILKPYFQKKLNSNADNQDSLQDNIHEGYFQIVQETRDANKQIMVELKTINATNANLTTINQQLSETNSRLVESYDRRICTLEVATEDIGKTVEKINTKMDIILK